jgi:hypothetical protein
MMLLVLVALALEETPVVVSSLTTTQLVEFCRGKDSDAAPNFCTGYIMGEFDALSVAHEICPSPTRSSMLKVVSAARKYLRTHPAEWTSAPSFVVRDALRAAFPCKHRP